MTVAKLTITTLATVIGLTLAALLSLQGPSLAATTTSPPQAASPHQSVKGEVIIVMDEFYVVKDAVGKGLVQVLVSKATKLDSSIKMGDRVEAQLSVDGYAVSVKKVDKNAE